MREAKRASRQPTVHAHDPTRPSRLPVAVSASLPDVSRARKRTATTALVALVVALCVAGAARVAPGLGADARLLCGVERWSVKTLQDRPSLLPVRTTTLRFLVTRPAPQTLPSTRLPFERHVYRVTAAVTLVRPEDDGDFHLVLRDGALHMIAEAPSTSCVVGATPVRRAQIQAARAAVRLCARAQITGVAFFDFKHGQTGVAPNAIELHPILNFRCLSG